MNRSATRVPISRGEAPAGQFSKLLIFVTPAAADTPEPAARSATNAIQTLFMAIPRAGLTRRANHNVISPMEAIRAASSTSII